MRIDFRRWEAAVLGRKGYPLGLVITVEWRRLMRHIVLLAVVALVVLACRSGLAVAAQEAATATPDAPISGTLEAGVMIA